MKNFTRTTVSLSAIFVMILVFSAVETRGGIRATGEYSGIVVFDRWDTCYLYSSTYLMYISEKRKELLRPYVGRSIRINATEVFQPVNPGDGLITEFQFLGYAPISERLPGVKGLKLTLRKERFAGNSLRFIIEIENENRFGVALLKSEIAPTVFGRTLGDPESPSDGDSEAKITRCNFGSHCGYFGLSYGPDGQLASDSYSVDLDRSFKQDPYITYLAGGQKIDFNFYVRVSKGDYDLIVGYGGGVHEGRSVASNILSFTTDVIGNARGASELFWEPVSDRDMRPSLLSMIYGDYLSSGSTAFSSSR